MSANEEIKKKTAKLLEDGGIFAFGLSERTHGADLYSITKPSTKSRDRPEPKARTINDHQQSWWVQMRETKEVESRNIGWIFGFE